jgi:hypothetical protein
MSIAPERTHANPLLLLLTPILLVPGRSLKLQGTIVWVIDINVCTWSGIWSLNPLVHRSLFSTIECSVNCLLLYYPVFNIILFLFMVVLSRSWILGESLSCVWSFSFMLPELTSLGLGQERLWLLANKLAI